MTVRWGILGAGWIVTTATAAAIHEADGAVLQAAAARDLARATVTEPLAAYDSYAALLDDPDVDAVYIALANDAHLPWITAALESGRHVLCEKPLAMSRAEAAAAFALAESSGLVLVEAAWSRWHPRMRRAIELATTGALGSLHFVTGTFTFTGVPEGNYRLERGRGGGALLDVGVYPLHTLVACLPDPGLIEAVEVQHRTHSSGVDLATSATLTWGPGTRAQITASFVDPEQQVLRIAGSAGSLELTGNDAFTSWRSPSELVIDGRVESFPAVDAYRLMVEQVSAVIEGRPGWVVPGSESLAVAHLTDLLAGPA